MAPTRVLIGNQKGGSGKSTTAANFAAVLAEAGDRVLAVDLDPQAHLGSFLGANLVEIPEGARRRVDISDVLEVEPGTAIHALADAVVTSPYHPGIDVVTASRQGLQRRIFEINANANEGQLALSRMLSDENLAANGLQYDWIVLDTAPSIDNLLRSAMRAVDFVLPVLAPEEAQVEAVQEFLGEIDRTKQLANPNLRDLPVLLNKIDPNKGKAYVAEMIALLGAAGVDVFDSWIPHYVAISRTFSAGPMVLRTPNTAQAGILRGAMYDVRDRMLGVHAE